MSTAHTSPESLVNSHYKYGFVSDIESEIAPKGLSETTIRFLSAKKNEPDWLLNWRLEAFALWQKMKEPHWAKLNYPSIDYQSFSYYAEPKQTSDSQNLKEIDPRLLETYDRLGIPLHEREALTGNRPHVAVNAVFDSVSVATTYRETLEEKGVIFCSLSEAVQKYPALVRKYLGSVVPARDNFFAALNAAVFSGGTFVFIPKGVRCPMDLSTYFRINTANTGQFERTLIIAEDDSYVSYLEGCSAPKYDHNQLHAAVVELVALDRAEIKFAAMQNWYPGDENGKGGVYNFVTKRGHCKGTGSKIFWTAVETGSAMTWAYPSCILSGDNSSGAFYSIAITNNYQQADTGTRMVHLGKNTRSTIISKGISAGHAQNSYRGLVRMSKGAKGAYNKTQCDSLLIGNLCGARTFPDIVSRQPAAKVEHEATTSKISEEQLFYCRQRGLSSEEAMSLIVNGFCREVIKEMPIEFALEAQKLIGVSLEGSIG